MTKAASDDVYSLCLREFQDACAGLDGDGRREDLTATERREKTRLWWQSLGNLLHEALSTPDKVADELKNAVLMIQRTSRDIARGRIPPLIGDAGTAGNISTEAMERNLDLATVYLLACRREGYENRYGRLQIDDKRANCTIAEWFGADKDHVRKKWKRRAVSEDVWHTEDEIAFVQRVQQAGSRYTMWGRTRGETG